VDNVSNTIISFLQQMADHSDVQQRVQEEIDSVLAGDRFVEVDDLDKLSYFWCAMKETARTRPLFVIKGGRMTIYPMSWRGFVFPTDTYFFPQVQSSMENRDQFDPSRHQHNPRFDLIGKKDVTMPFFGGFGRFCPGANLADKELGLMGANILKCFTVRPATASSACGDPRPIGLQTAPIHVPLIFESRTNVEQLTGLREE